MGYVFPVSGGGRITSPWGQRSAPVAGASTFHRGVDIGGARGTPIVAPIGGTVLFSGTQRGYGNRVELMGSDGVKHAFSHLDSRSVQPGMNIGAGQVLGTLGATGNVSGAHLHYETYRGGKRFNPSGILSSAKSAALGEGKSLLNKGLSFIKGDGLAGMAGDAAVTAANAYLPGSGAVLGALGIGGESCGFICQFQNWIKESGFFQRLALALFAFILLFAGFYLMKGNVLSQATAKLKGA